jgi:hypothetical protein
MKYPFSKISRFFWSWGFLKFVLWAVTLIIFLYVEEDWRGARAWAATKAEWEAKGESFDFNRLIPPPVPDEQNLAAIPLFKLEPDLDPENKGNLAPLALHRACRAGQRGNDVPTGGWGNYQRGKLPDMGKIRQGVATDYAEAFKTAPPINDPLTQFDALYPFIADLRTAAATRPYCRFEQNYRFEPPYNLYLSLLAAQIATSRILTNHALLALDAHKLDLALEDIKINFELISGLREQPLLVSGLCAVGGTAVSISAVYPGLALHAWNDPQLADLQNKLAKIDFLSDYQLAMRGEAIGMVIPAFDNIKVNRPRLADALKTHDENKYQKLRSESRNYFPDFWADGWIDLMKTRSVSIDLNAVSFVDSKARLVFPKTADQFAAENARVRWDSYAPWNIFSAVSAGPIANAVSQFTKIQVWVDEARIACALERYRLAHGVYPGSFDALAPAYIGDLPHDIMNGEPYHYRLRPDGTFLLYSVGWNQIDDGGKVVYHEDAPTVIGKYAGDWPWPTPQAAPVK